LRQAVEDAYFSALAELFVGVFTAEQAEPDEARGQPAAAAAKPAARAKRRGRAGGQRRQRQ
jgi:hypothetical protein